MKKTLLFVAAALLSSASFAQTVTNVGEEGENNKLSIPSGNKVYQFYKAGDETNALLGINEEDATAYMYVGPNEEALIHFYQWDGSSTVTTIEGMNSHGVLGEGSQFNPGTAGWTGWGVNVDKDTSIDLSGITTDYTFHAGIKRVTEDAALDFYIVDGNETEFHFTKNITIPADGNWYSVDMSMQDIQDQFGLDFSGSKNYTNLNTLCFLWGATGTVQVDNVMFYGPKTSTGISTVANAEAVADNAYYNIAGQRVAKGTKGLLIHQGKKILVK